MGFLIHLESGQRLQAHVYLCFDDSQPSGAADSSGRRSDSQAAAASDGGGSGCSSSGRHYAW